MTAPAPRLEVERVSEHIHAVRTAHVNWAVYSGPDGVTVVDSGYPGDYPLLEESLRRTGLSPRDVTAVLLTHAHIDHLGGAVRLASDHGIPVLTGAEETRHAHREYLQQAATGAVLRNAWRPGVLRWAIGALRLIGGDAGLALPQASSFDPAADRLPVPGRPRALLVPGHTSGHTVYEFPEESVLLVGDALVTAHPTSRWSGPQLLPSVFHADLPLAADSLVALSTSAARVVVPGHGPVRRGAAASAAAEAFSRGAPW